MSDFLPFEQTGLAQAVEGGALAGVTQEEQGIFVPEAQEEVEFSDDATGIDLDSLIGLYLEVGQEGLTEEEFLIIEPLLIERERKSAASENHNANLAEHVDDSALTKIAQDVLQWVQWDQQSREAWYKQEKAGIEALGVLPDDNVKANFDGGSKVIHPVIAEASVQFQARAMDSLWPAGGPVDTAVLGQANKEKQQQAKRVEKYMNYQYTTGIQGAYDQFDKMMIRLPLSGSCFSKVYFDHNLKQVTRKHIEPAYFLVPYKADDLRTAPRYTEIIKTSTNDVRKLQVAGYYSDVNLLQPSDNHEGGQYDEGVDERIRETEGRNDGGYFQEDYNRTIYETVCNLDLPGFEDTKDGEKTGIALPYIVSVDRDSQKVLAIYRNWKPEDPAKERIIYTSHYKFLPGLGFYGYGLFHWIGGLSRAATGSLRALLDAAAFSNLPAGYRSKDAGIKGDSKPLAPGEWREIDCDAEDLSKAFFPAPYSEPSGTLFSLLGHVEGIMGRFAATTESMIGDGSQNTPVGTILARIEQGSKIHTGIQKRLHRALGEELKTVAWLNSNFLDEDVAVQLSDEELQISKQDFDDRIDVIPVSDPNFVSNTQRYFIAQAALDVANQAPHLYDMRELHRRVLLSLRIDDPDKLLPDPEKLTVRRNAVDENALAILGKPIKAFQEQAHDAHIFLHQQALSGLPGNHPAAAIINAHIQEHLAMQYLQQVQNSTGIRFVLPGEDMEELPIEVENQIAMVASQALQEQLAQQQEQQNNQPDPKMLAAQAEQQRKDFVAQSEQARKDQIAQAEIARKDVLAEEELNLEAQKSAVKMALEDIEKNRSSL